MNNCIHRRSNYFSYIKRFWTNITNETLEFFFLRLFQDYYSKNPYKVFFLWIYQNFHELKCVFVTVANYFSKTLILPIKTNKRYFLYFIQEILEFTDVCDYKGSKELATYVNLLVGTKPQVSRAATLQVFEV